MQRLDARLPASRCIVHLRCPRRVSSTFGPAVIHQAGIARAQWNPSGASGHAAQQCPPWLQGRPYTASISANMQSFKSMFPSNTKFALKRITGDGSCMFRAIVQGAQIATKGKPMPEESEYQAALNLRQAVVKELRDRRDEIKPFIPGIADDWEGYLERMSHPTAWGGEPEALMAANVVRRPINVWRLVHGQAELIVTYGGEIGGQPIHLLWSGNHYDLLLPSQQQQQEE